MRSCYFKCIVVAILLALVSPSAASAAPCGQPAETGGEATVGELSLDTSSSSDPAISSFKKQTKSKELSFVFNVSGCTLSDDTDIEVEIVGDERDAITLQKPSPRRSRLIIKGAVNPKDFTPGSHKPTILLDSKSGQVKAQSLRVALERAQPPFWPTVVTILGLLGGFGYAVVVARAAAKAAYNKAKKERQDASEPIGEPGEGEKEIKVETDRTFVFVALVAAAALTYAAYKTGYQDSNTWTPEFFSYLALFAAAAAASAGGAAAGLAKAVAPKAVGPTR